jgi:DNA-directed RNA polymerase specialized sigma24 family protein
VSFETTPEPTPEEREAIEQALERAADGLPPQYRSAWLAAGMRENAAPLEDALDPAYAGRPRSTRGATRA